MPIVVGADVRPVSQAEFARVAYAAMGFFFAVHNDMGRLFSERIFKQEVARRHGDIATEVPVKVIFDDFEKPYSIDMLVSGCGVFEVKAGRCLVPEHRAQLLHYLKLTGVPRGKLVNIRPESIEHEFLNALSTLSDRTQFQLVDVNWQPISVKDVVWKEWFVEAVRDWGVDLSLSLYYEAIVHVLGGWDRVRRKTEVLAGGEVIGRETVLLTGAETMFRVTAFPREVGKMEDHLRRFLRHTRLEAIQWVNINRQRLTFHTIRR